MQNLTPGPDDFPARQASGSLPAVDLARDAILLDVDGTILDIAPTPQEVRVSKALFASLDMLVSATAGATALVSGRLIEILDSLFSPLRFAAIGCHGAQIRRTPDAQTERRISPLPQAVRRALADIAHREPNVRSEDKIFTMAFHFRKAREREEPLLELLRRRLAPFANDFVILRGKSVFEIRPRGCNKGEALRALMQCEPFRGRRPVFLGDDDTDEDAFAILKEFGGVGISVGRHSPNAQYALTSPRDVRRWLVRLAGAEHASNVRSRTQDV